jgi:hypothetical protein
MFCLSDAGLAYLVIAASRVPVDDRAAWLADIARKLELPPAPTAGARDMRTCRQRKRDGLIWLPIVMDEALLAVGLVEAGLPSPLHADDKKAMAAAAAKALAEYCNGGDASRHDAVITDRVRVELLAAAARRGPRGRLSRRGSQSTRPPSRRRRR